MTNSKREAVCKVVEVKNAKVNVTQGGKLFDKRMQKFNIKERIIS